QEYDTKTGNLVGDSFLIGRQTLSRIPGFDPKGSVPNSVLVSLPNAFDTTNYGGKDLVFWVLVFMLDASGGLVAEVPEHGLTGNPVRVAYRQITDVPIEQHSNNLGMYDVYSPFHILQKPELGAPPEPTKGLARVHKVSLPSHKLLLNQRVRISAELTTGGTA